MAAPTPTADRSGSETLQARLHALGFTAKPIWRDGLMGLGAWTVTVDGEAFLDLSDHAPARMADAFRRQLDEGALDGLLRAGQGVHARTNDGASTETTEDDPLALGERLDALEGRFPDLLRQPTRRHALEWSRLTFHLGTPDSDTPDLDISLADALRQLMAAMGVRVSVSGDEVRLTVHILSTRSVDFAFDCLRRSLKHLETLPTGATPTDLATMVARFEASEAAPTLRRPQRPSRVRVATAEEADVLVPKLLALEASIFEPARRDPPEKLRAPIDHPDGVAVVAELLDEETPELVGFSLAMPLELIKVDGPLQDVFRGRDNTLYAVSTTLGERARGLGLGLRLKQALTEEARRLRKADGHPRYQFISGRNQVGSTVAMQRVNARLGAYEVTRYDKQYGGDGQAIYYRMPVGIPARVPKDAEGCVTRDAPLRRLPDSWKETLREGTPTAAFLRHHVLADALHPRTVGALERIAGLLPRLPRLSVFRNEHAALHLLHGRGVTERIVRVADRGVPPATPADVIAIESELAFGRGGLWPLQSRRWAEPPAHVVWAPTPTVCFLHSPASFAPVLGEGDEFAIMWTAAMLDATENHSFDLSRWNHLMKRLKDAGVDVRGVGAHRVLKGLRADHPLREALAQSGWLSTDSDGDAPISMRPYFDIDEGDFVRLAGALDAVFPSP